MAYAEMPTEPSVLIGPNAAPEELYRAGLAYAAGIGTDVNLIEAHKWFNLAAARGHDEAKAQRRELAELLSADEIKIALEAARAWLKLAN